MAKKRTTITTDQVISTLVHIRFLTDALIATLMAQTGVSWGELPDPVSAAKPYEKDCPPPVYRKDCPPPSWAKDCAPPPYRKDCAPPAWAKDCAPPPAMETVAVKARLKNCPTYQVSGPIEAPRAAKRAPRRK